MQHFEQLVFFYVIADYRRQQLRLRETGIDAGRYCLKHYLGRRMGI